MHREKESWRAAAGRWTTHPSLPAASCRRHCPARSRSRHRLAGHLDAASLVLRLPLGETGGDGGGACWWPSPLTCSAAFRFCWFGGSPHDDDDDDGHEARWAGGRAVVSLPICTKYIRRHGVFRTKPHGTAMRTTYMRQPSMRAYATGPVNCSSSRHTACVSSAQITQRHVQVLYVRTTTTCDGARARPASIRPCRRACGPAPRVFRWMGGVSMTIQIVNQGWQTSILPPRRAMGAHLTVRHTPFARVSRLYGASRLVSVL